MYSYDHKNFIPNTSALYPDLQGLAEGICYGLSMMYIQACLVDTGNGHEIETFMRRLAFLSQTHWHFNGKPFTNLPALIDEARHILLSKSFRARYLIPEARRIVDCQAFLDGVLTHQEKHPLWPYQNVMARAPLLKPVELERPIRKAYGHVLVTDRTKLADYLKPLFATEHGNANPPFTLLISNAAHTVALTEHGFFDQNGSCLVRPQNASEAANIIINALKRWGGECPILSITAFAIASLNAQHHPRQPPFEPDEINYVCQHSGNTPLYFACQEGHLDVAVLLLEHGADVNQLGYNGFTPLDIAYQNGHLELVQLLLNSASEHGQLEFVRLLLNNGAHVNQAGPNGQTPLLIAVDNGHLEVVQLLLKRGAEVNKAATSGWRPFHLACSNGQLEFVRLLLNNGAHVNQAGPNGQTPLHIACGNGYVEVVRLLLQHGAKNQTRNNDGKLPFHYLNKNDLAYVVAWVYDHRLSRRLDRQRNSHAPLALDTSIQVCRNAR